MLNEFFGAIFGCAKSAAINFAGRDRSAHTSWILCAWKNT
jgi:hypothetical protein